MDTDQKTALPAPCFLICVYLCSSVVSNQATTGARDRRIEVGVAKSADACLKCSPMKRLLVLTLLAFTASATLVRAENADDQYFHIYNLIQQADSVNASAQPAVELVRY